jgi:hypothetical protein
MDPADQQLQALQAQLQQQAAMIAAIQTQQQPQVGPFALTPALANKDVIDMTTTAGIKLCKSIKEPLETKFDASPSKLASFLDDVQQKATHYGWDNALLRVSDQKPINLQVHDLYRKRPSARG